MLPARRLLSAGGRLLPVACCPSPAACFLPGAARRLLPAFCFLLCAARCPPPVVCPAGCPRLPVRVAGGVVWHFWHCGTRIVPGSFLLFLPLPVAPGFFVLFPPPLPRAGTPRKSNGASVVRMRRRWGICLPLFGEFPGSPASVGLGPQP